MSEPAEAPFPYRMADVRDIEKATKPFFPRSEPGHIFFREFPPISEAKHGVQLTGKSQLSLPGYGAVIGWSPNLDKMGLRVGDTIQFAQSGYTMLGDGIDKTSELAQRYVPVGVGYIHPADCILFWPQPKE